MPPTELLFSVVAESLPARTAVCLRKTVLKKCVRFRPECLLHSGRKIPREQLYRHSDRHRSYYQPQRCRSCEREYYRNRHLILPPYCFSVLKRVSPRTILSHFRLRIPITKRDLKCPLAYQHTYPTECIRLAFFRICSFF